jgi:hypothetical protein
MDLLGDHAAHDRAPVLEGDGRLVRDRSEQPLLLVAERRVAVADELAYLTAFPPQRQSHRVFARPPLGPSDRAVLEDESGARRPDGVDRRLDDRLERLLQVQRLGNGLRDGRKRLQLRDAPLRVLVQLGVFDRLRHLARDRHQEVDLRRRELARLLRAHVERALEPLLGQDRDGEDRLVVLLAQVREALEARVEMRLSRDHHRCALSGRRAGDALSGSHLGHRGHLVHPRPEGGAQDELAAPLVVEVDKASIRLERLGDLMGDEIEDLIEVKGGVDRRDRLCEQPQMAGRAVHGESLRQHLATPITRG